MKLYNNKEDFIEIITATSNYYGIEKGQVEKDYFVTLFLQKAVERIQGLVFKGGTSLSKCHKIIDRFSEDIDLTLDKEHFTQSQKRNANKIIIQLCDELGLNLKNREFLEKHSHGNYNSYIIDYPILFPLETIRPELKVEMAFIQKAYPDEKGVANSYIGEYLKEIGRYDIIDEYELNAFPVKIQALERTLVDKVFAICDYYLRNEELRNSRHIYDISRLLTKVELNESTLKPLAEKVRIDRQPNKTCVSAQDGVNVPKVLQEIVDTNFFKKDYVDTTDKLLVKPVQYEDAILSVSKIIESNIFDFNNHFEFKRPAEIINEQTLVKKCNNIDHSK